MKRDLSGKQYVYVWADGTHVKVRLEDDANKKQCILVLMGATADGKKELIAALDGYRESEQSWSELLLDLKYRGLTTPPKIAVGDGALGFWAALRKVFPETKEQRCWKQPRPPTDEGGVRPRAVARIRERAEQDAQERSAESEGRHPRNLAGGNESRCRDGFRSLPGEI